MAGLDTNLLVRWLVDDDRLQRERIAERFSAAREHAEPLFVPITVMLELEWVLRSRYGYPKRDVLHAFNALLETQELVFQDEPAIERALHAYRSETADFADALHAALCQTYGHAPMITLDAKAARLRDAELLGR